MEKRRVRLHKKLKADWPLRLLAVVLAIVIWFILSITKFPTIFMTINSVPVEVSIEGTSAEALGLSIIDYNEDMTVDVSIKGMRYEIGSFSADDLHATVDLSGITEPGTYTLNIKVSSGAESCEFTKISPSTVKVKVDYIKTVTVPLKVRANSISADEGYSLGTPVVTPGEISVKGPAKLVDEVGYAVYAIDQKKTLTEAYTTSAGELCLYSSGGALIDDEAFELEYDPISVNFPVYFLKNLKFTFDYQGVPANFDTSVLRYTLSDDSIDILTSNEGILNQDELHLGYINLSTINLEDKFVFDVNLDAGLTSTSGIDKVTVTFDPTGFVSKEISLPASNINIINAPNHQDITLSTKVIPSVVIYGPQDVMETLSADDIIAEYDMQSTILDDGSYTRNVKIYAPQINSVWCFGSYDIVFSVAEKQQPIVPAQLTGENAQ